MEEKTRLEVKNVQRVLQVKNPAWPQDKARWMAMQALGIIKH